jgi:hypothetical protein
VPRLGVHRLKLVDSTEQAFCDPENSRDQLCGFRTIRGIARHCRPISCREGE